METASLSRTTGATAGRFPEIRSSLPSPSKLSGLDKARLAAPFDPATVKRGYPRSLDSLTPAAPHTLHDVGRYVADNLGTELVEQVRRGPPPQVVVLVGESRAALAAASTTGWTVGQRVEKREGFHQVYHATSPNGRAGFVITRVNGDDRTLHVQSLLKLAGLPGSQLTTLGRTYIWTPALRDSFARLGHVPDAVLWGFPNTTMQVVLTSHMGNWPKAAHHALFRLGGAQATPAMVGSDLDGLDMQVLEFRNGKRLWLMRSMYGDLARHAIDALLEHGVRNLAFAGTAGALSAELKVGDVVTPRRTMDEHGVHVLSDSGVTHVSVPTPNIETLAWVDTMSRRGADVVECELKYFADAVRGRPEVRFVPRLVVSDVLCGPERADMTEWRRSDALVARPALREILDQLLGQGGRADLRLASYRTVPLLAGNPT